MENAQHDFEKVLYSSGAPGFANVDLYDFNRYQGPSKGYRQQAMAYVYGKQIGATRGLSILNVGCGTGRGATECLSEGAKVVGLDLSMDMLQHARASIADSKNFQPVRGIGQQLPFADESFDRVVSLNFLHLFRLESQRILVREMRRVLRTQCAAVFEFDNALHGFGLGLYKRWFRNEKGSFPWEIASCFDRGWRVACVSGAVYPVIWRCLHKFPGIALKFERTAQVPPLNIIAARLYVKAIKI